MVEPTDRQFTSDDLQPKADRDSSKGCEDHAAHKQPAEPQPKPKQENRVALQFQDTPTQVPTPSQQPLTDSQLHEWLGGPQQPSQELLGILAASQEPNITVGTQDSQSLHALMASEAARAAAKVGRSNTAAVDTAFKETALKEAAVAGATSGLDNAMVVLHNGHSDAAARTSLPPDDTSATPAAAPLGAATTAVVSGAMPTDSGAAAALMAGMANPAALHALAAAAAAGGIPAAVSGQQLSEADYNQQLQQHQQYYQQLQALTYQQQLQHQRHASVAKPEHAHSLAKRRGPMDEMRQLQRILTKLLPRSAIYMPSGSDGGGNKVQAEQIKVYLTATLGDAPKPDWGLKQGWGQYLADLFNWATGGSLCAVLALVLTAWRL
eukprot:GHUV01009400.1.p1 GENE.GHUV01009400.1~~GHUV01009400.1.p1  ORF type:complete len:380 (+),score=138.05 GHUV01009400.1:813-1952(+)